MKRDRKRHYVADNPHVVNQIVERDLCVRCGACEPACPADIIRMDERAYPYVTDESLCPEACERCLRICPGEDLDLTALDRKMFGVSPHPESITGVALQAYMSFSTDPQVRADGASGGFVTQLLLYMLEQGEIDGALVLGQKPNSQGSGLEPMIARTPDELKQAASSKYQIAPHLRALAEIEQAEGRYAIVALPCHAHALRKYQATSKKLRDRIALVIGLYCNVTFEDYIYDDLIDFAGLERDEVVDVDFRSGAWPGGIVARTRDGRSHKLLKLEEMRDSFNTLKLFYTPPRCKTCTDYSAEYADIAVGDPWLKGSDGKLIWQDGRTTVLARTTSAQDLLRRAAADGHLMLETIPLKLFMMNFEKSAAYKRDFAPLRIRLLQALGRPVPHYNRPMGRPLSAGVLLGFAFRQLASWGAGSRGLRRFGLWLAQSRLAIRVMRWNRSRKMRNFSKSYAKMKTFAERVALPVLGEERKKETRL